MLIPDPEHKFMQDRSLYRNFFGYGYLHGTNPSWKQGQRLQAQGICHFGRCFLVGWLFELWPFQGPWSFYPLRFGRGLFVGRLWIRQTGEDNILSRWFSQLR